MQILGILGMYFDAVVVEVEKPLLFFKLALAILCCIRLHINVSALKWASALLRLRQNLQHELDYATS